LGWIDVLSEKLKNIWDSLADNAIEQITGVFHPEQHEYILTLPQANRSFCYSLETGQWRERSFENMYFMTNDPYGKVVATDRKKIYILDSGYNLNGTTMVCQARTKKFTLDKKMYFELMRIFLLYVCRTGTLSLKIYSDDALKRTLSLSNQTAESMIHLALTGYTSGNSLFLRNMQLEFLLSAPVINDGINEVGLEYNLVDLL